MRELRSKLRWLDVEEVDERRGLVVRRERGEGFVDGSVSSTSNDRFSARKHRTFLVRQETEESLNLYRCLNQSLNYLL